MKHLIKQLLNEETNKIMLLEELSLLIEKELAIGPGLKKKIDNINKPYADKLLQFLSSDSIPDKVTIDSIDYTSDDDKTLTGYFKDREGNTKARKFKIGKLLTYVGLPKDEFKGYEIEELISHLKKGTTEDFKIVEGDDILKAYHCENYDEGETMGSCMRYEAAQSYLSIYTDNPNEVKCLVLLNPNNGKVRGRALIWHMDNDEYFMDRVYVTNDGHRNLFNIYKEENNISNRAKSTVTLENGGEYDEYPYMDTFEYLNKEEGVLMTNSDGSSETIRLQDTSGGYVPAGVYIDYGDHEGETVEEDEAYYISYRTPDGYREGYAHQDDIIYTDGEIFLLDDCIKTYDGEWVFKYGDEYVIELTAGRFDGEYAKLDDSVELETNHYGENQYITNEDDYINLDDDIYEIPYAFTDDTVQTYNDKVIIKDDAIRLYEPHYGEYNIAHPDDCTKVDIKGHGEAWVLDDDLDEFEENGLIGEIKEPKSSRNFIQKLLREGLGVNAQEDIDDWFVINKEIGQLSMKFEDKPYSNIQKVFKDDKYMILDYQGYIEWNDNLDSSEPVDDAPEIDYSFDELETSFNNNKENCDCCKYFDMESANNGRFGGMEHPVYFIIEKNEIDELEFISPKQYIENIAKGFGMSYEDALNSSYNEELSNKYAEAMKRGDKFPVGFYVDGKNEQEGRHRAMAAMKLDCEYIPVVKVTKISRDYAEGFVRKYKDFTYEQLGQLFKEKGYNGISSLDWRTFKNYIEYRLDESISILESLELPIMKNMEPAQNYGSMFGQDVEPSGTYVSHDDRRDKTPINNYKFGKVAFNNPLIIDITDDTIISYKNELSKQFKAKGKTLTKKLIAKGYDGLVTRWPNGTYGEVVIFPNATYMLT